VFDSLFQLLFEYRPVVFQQGDFRFDPSAGAYAATVVAIAATAATVNAYRGPRRRGRARDRAILGALRVATIALLVFCLFRPVLIVKAAVPQQNFLGIILDDSRSMQIADANGAARSEFVRRQLAAGSPLMKALGDRYVLRVFRFSSGAARVGSSDELTFAGAQTRIGAALESARQELAGLSVAGLVLVSDGADTTDAALTSSLLALKAADLPVFTVGVGRETQTRDVQVDRVTTPRSVLKGTSLLLDAVITQTGYAGETVTLDVEDEGRIVGSQQVRLPPDGGPAAVRVRATASEPGARVFRFRIAPRPGELVTQNNARESLIDVRDGREKILYFEGEPRFELKFIRRAVTEDKNLQVVALQRTADNKYLRLDVDHPDELIAGFPKTREELFAYRGLILGSIEAGAFTGDQLRMIAEFVDRRGGGLLALGGPRAFSAGGYGGTAVADVLPVVVERTAAAETLPVYRLKVAPTRAGEAHAVTQLAANESASTARWSTLPPVTTVNPIATAKPGASALLTGTDEGHRRHIVLAAQRYGRGKAIAFTPQDSWLWQMHASIDVDDKTHENFWGQLLRWLVDGVPGPVEIRTTTDRVEPGDTVDLTAHVTDPTFVDLNDARVVARVTPPTGAPFDVSMQWTGERAGEYRATFVAADRGHYEAKADATRGGTPLGSAVTHLRAAPGDAEYFDATMHAERLRRIAEETGGRFYNADTVKGLPEDLKYAGRGVTTVEERELWHMPIVLLTLVALVCGEWGYRRKVGLA
jgi:uncharacterized membrane protein